MKYSSENIKKMKCKLLSLVVLSAITLSCNQPNYNGPIPYEALRDETIVWSLSSLCLMDHKRSVELTDSNSFYFARTGPPLFTYSLMLRKIGPTVFGIYHWNNKSTRYAYDSDTIFFHGFRFQMDSLTWADVISKSDHLLSKTIGSTYHDRSGSSYVLSYGGKSVAVNEYPIKREYKEFSEYIIKSIIAPVEKLRNRDGEILLPIQD